MAFKVWTPQERTVIFLKISSMWVYLWIHSSYISEFIRNRCSRFRENCQFVLWSPSEAPPFLKLKFPDSPYTDLIWTKSLNKNKIKLYQSILPYTGARPNIHTYIHIAQETVFHKPLFHTQEAWKYVDPSKLRDRLFNDHRIF